MIAVHGHNTLACSVVGVDGVPFLTAAIKPSNRVGADLMTTTIEQRALVNI